MIGRSGVNLRRLPNVEFGALMEAVDRNGDVVCSRGTSVSYEAVAELCNNETFSTILDVGCGRQAHSDVFRACGKIVTTIDPYFPADIQLDFLKYHPHQQFDAVFCSHVLEHQRNIGLFCDRLFAVTKLGGVLCVTTPPEMIHWVCFGHNNQLNAGFLLYHLILAGFDCSDAKILTYGYNVSVIVRKIGNNLPNGSWALEKDQVLPFLPKDIEIIDNQYKGSILKRAWEPVLDIPPHFNSGL